MTEVITADSTAEMPEIPSARAESCPFAPPPALRVAVVTGASSDDVARLALENLRDGPGYIPSEHYRKTFDALLPMPRREALTAMARKHAALTSGRAGGSTPAVHLYHSASDHLRRS